MDDCNVFDISQQNNFKDSITELIRNGAKNLIQAAVEVELCELMEQYANQTVDGKARLVRNGYLPQRTIQTGVGDVAVKLPKVRDRGKQGVKFNSKLIPPYLKKTQSIEELLPVLYLKGISTGDFQEALASLLGPQAKGLSSSTISQLKKKWQNEYNDWNKRDLSLKHYVYIWADGIHFNIRSDDDKSCILVLIGATDKGKKELIAIEDGHRESAASWRDLLLDVKQRGLEKPPKLAIGDGALGFWKAINEIYPSTRHQRCWVHKMSNVLNKVPKSVQPKLKEALQSIWMAETRKAAIKSFDNTIARFEAKYPKAMACLEKDRDELLAFYDFPAQHWPHIRTTNPIESTFATVRLRTAKTRNCVSRTAILSMVFKLVQSAEKRWNRLRGFKLLADVIVGVQFIDGEKQQINVNQEAA